MILTSKKPCSLLFLSGVAVVAVAPAAFSQELNVAEVAGQLPTIQANDLVTGQNKPGPYSLGWNHFLRDLNHPVSVSVDGVNLSNDGYTIDPVKGTIVFTAPLKGTSIARVAYQYDPASAKRNADFMQAPITVPLLHAAGTDLQLTALPDSVSGDGTTKLIYGLNRQTNLLGGGLTSKALIAGSGSSLDFGYKYGSTRNGFDAAFQRTEREFATHFGKPLNLATPASTLSLGGHLRPTDYLGLGMTTSDQHDLTANTDTTQKGMTLNLGGVKTEPALNFARVVSVTDTALKVATDTTTDKADLTAKVGALTSVTAKGQIVDTNAPGTASDTTKQDATVAVAAISKDKKQQASLTLTDSTGQTATTDNKNQDIQVKLQPMPVFTLSAEQKDTKTAPAGTATTPVATDTKTTLGAEVTPLKATKLTGTMSTDVQGDAHIAVKGLDAQVGTGKAVEIGGGITDRSAESTPSEPHALADTGHQARDARAAPFQSVHAVRRLYVESRKRWHGNPGGSSGRGTERASGRAGIRQRLQPDDAQRAESRGRC